MRAMHVIRDAGCVMREEGKSVLLLLASRITHHATASLFVLLALCLATLAGCVSSKPTSTPKSPVPTASGQKSQLPDPGPDLPGKPTAPLTNTDPCAERLHSLCGPLLFYVATNHKMPDRVDELRNLTGPDPLMDFTCPVSHLPYVYAPQGIPRSKNQPGMLVLYDAAPTHSGMRLAVCVEQPPRPGQPLVMKVVAEPETTFHAGK